MRSVGNFSNGAEVVDPVQVGGRRCCIISAEEEVDGVRVAGTERGGELVAGPGGG